LPFFDALVVFINRIYNNKNLIFKPWKVLSLNDKSHFHHRLLALGFSHKGVMLVEASVTLILCTLALYLENFRLEAVAIVFAAALMLTIIAILATLQRRVKVREKVQEEVKEREEAKVQVEVVERQKGKDIYRY
jgi:hypothetical protein